MPPFPVVLQKEFVEYLFPALSIILSAGSVILIWLYLQATLKLVKETNEQAKATKELVEISREEYEPNVQVIFDNTYLEEFQNTRIFRIINNEKMELISKRTNISSSTIEFNLVFQSITFNNEKEGRGKGEAYLEKFSRTTHILKPKESLIIKDYIILDNEFQEQFMQLFNVQRTGFIDIEFRLKYNNNLDNILERWRFTFTNANVNQSICQFFGEWSGPFRNKLST